MESKPRTKIKSFRDLDVYNTSYRASILMATKILPKLPAQENYDLKDQLARSSKAIPRLIAEGYAKKHQKHGFQKYLDDAMAEVNETIVGLEQIKDIYKLEVKICDDLIDQYDKVARQLYRLAEAWNKFSKRTTSTDDNTGSYTAKR